MCEDLLRMLCFRTFMMVTGDFHAIVFNDLFVAMSVHFSF